MKKFSYQLGVDVAKDTLDCTLLQAGKKLHYQCIDNTPKGVQSYLQQLKKQGIALTDILFCMEHTGVYNAHVLAVLRQQECSMWIEVDATRPLSVSRNL